MIEYRAAEFAEIVQVRHEVIISGTDRTSDYFPGDELGTTIHFGAFQQKHCAAQEKHCVACLTLMLNPLDGTPAYQLRGMATLPLVRGTGVGKTMLQSVEHEVLQLSAIRLLWCNAREQVADFYIHCGWETISEPFMIEGVGMHVQMKKEILQ